MKKNCILIDVVQEIVVLFFSVLSYKCDSNNLRHINLSFFSFSSDNNYRFVMASLLFRIAVDLHNNVVH